MHIVNGHSHDKSDGRQKLLCLLSNAVGEDQAAQLVERSARVLGFDANAMRPEQCLRVLEHLAELPGLIGISARMAKTQLRMQALSKGRTRTGTA